MSKLCLLLILCFLCLFAISQKKKLVIVGSSTAAGVGASPIDSSWAARLNYHYKEVEKIIDTTINLAVPGSELYSAMPTSFKNPPDRVPPDPDHNITAAMRYSPDIVIVSFGGENFDVYSTQELRSVIQTIIDSANVKGAVCYITTNKPRTSLNAATRLKQSKLKDSILLWFNEFAINFWDSIVNPVDNTIAVPYRYSGDNIHLNNAGHAVLYRQVLAKDIFPDALPISITNANVLLTNNRAIISWEVADEEPNVKFIVEKKLEGKPFAAIGTIKGTGKNLYSYEDTISITGLTQYRIKVVLPDRSFYSNLLITGQNENGVVMNCYPSPAKSSITLEIYSGKQQSSELFIVNSVGIVVLRKTEPLSKNRNLLSVDLTKLAQGIYTVRLFLPQSQQSIVRSFIRN